MVKSKHEADLEALSQELARMREDFAALAATVKTQSETKAEEINNAEKLHAQGEHVHPGWQDIQQALEEVRTRGEKVIKDLASEVQRHPIRSLAAGIGIGFIIARLMGRGRNS